MLAKGKTQAYRTRQANPSFCRISRVDRLHSRFRFWSHQSRIPAVKLRGAIRPLVQSVGVRTPDMRSHLFHCQHAGRSVIVENVDIIANEADRADGGVIPVSAFALEFRED